MSILDELSDLFGDTILIQPGSENTFGDFVESGDEFPVSCRLSVLAKLVRDRDGRETVSSTRAILNGYYDLDVDNHRFTLPSDHDPHIKLKAIGIEKKSDENGPLYEVVILP